MLLLRLPLLQGLSVLEGETGERLAFFPLREGKEFSLVYIHSIHRSPVEERYRVVGMEISLDSLIYEDTAVGMPSDADDGGHFRIDEEGRYWIEGIGRAYARIALRTAHQVGVNAHQLIIQEERIPFASLVRPGSLVILGVERISLWEYWKGVNSRGGASGR